MKRLIAGIIVLAMIGCGDDGTDAKNGAANGAENAKNAENAQTTNTVAKQIKAADGGEVSLPGAKISIPAGALGADTEISIERKAAAEFTAPAGGIHGDVFNFGPEGLTFEAPVTLELAFSGSPTADQSAVMAYWDGTKWAEIAGSKVSGQKVTAPTDHFSSFTIIFRINGNDVDFGTCDGAGYVGCGGSPTGTWVLDGACFQLGDEESNPNCPEQTVTADVTLTGSIEVKADGTYANNFHQAAEITVTIPKACLPGTSTCADLNATDAGDSCTSITPSEDDDVNTGTWTTSGTEICFTGSDSDTPDCFQHCVDGDEWTVGGVSNDDDTQVIYKASRQ